MWGDPVFEIGGASQWHYLGGAPTSVGASVQGKLRPKITPVITENGPLPALQRDTMTTARSTT